MKTKLKYRIWQLWEWIKLRVDGCLYRLSFPIYNGEWSNEDRIRAFNQQDKNVNSQLVLVEGWWCIKLFNGDYLKMKPGVDPNQLELPLDDGCCQCKTPQKAIGFRNCISCCKPFKEAKA